jgi:hypothetical protein
VRTRSCLAAVLLVALFGAALVLVPPGPAAADPAPTPAWDTSQVQLVSRQTIAVGGVSYRWSFFRNEAYECQLTGHFTFGVLERTVDVGRARPLWTFMHGGGVGHFRPEGGYAGTPSQSAEETSADLLGTVRTHLGTSTPSKDSTVTRRVQEGYRLLVTSMCDHDLYAGLGSPNPYNEQENPGDTVDGLLATGAALDFVANGRPGLPGYPTGRIFLHGGSAGSAGAYHVAHNLSERGIVLNGVILDSYLVTTRFEALYAAGIVPQNGIQGFDQAIAQQKVGPYITDEDLLLESTAAAGWPVPVYAVVSTDDGQFGGPSPAIPEAVEDGFTNNARWVADLVQTSFEDGGVDDRSLVDVVVDGGHVLTPDAWQTALHDRIDDWIANAVEVNPRAPFGFADVGEGHPFVEDISWMDSSGISTGYADGTYRPSEPVSRQAMSAFLYRLRGEPSFADPTSASFTDVGPTAAFFTEVEWMAAEGISEGYEDGTYRPLEPVTRQAMSAFLHRTAGAPEVDAPGADPFEDVPAAHPFAAEISWMAAEGISEGYEDGTYRPDVEVSRQAMSAFLHRLACTPAAWDGDVVAPGTVSC